MTTTTSTISTISNIAASALTRWFVTAVSCDICPRGCSVDRASGQRGVCGASDELVVARAALHFWEEPPISGESGSGTVFFGNCPLRCNYCQNTVIAHGDVGQVVSVADVACMCLDLQEQGALNINFVTPTHYTTQVREATVLARSKGLHLPVVWNTGGYERADVIRGNAGTVDVYLTDFKYADAALGERYSRVSDYPDRALEALDAMVETAGPLEYDEYRGQERLVRGVVVRHLLLPGNLEDSKRVVRLLHERYGSAIRLSLMNQYTPVLATAAAAGDARAAAELARCPELAGRVPDWQYEELLDFADALGVEDYFWQEGGACEESFIPAFTSQL